MKEFKSSVFIFRTPKEMENTLQEMKDVREIDKDATVKDVPATFSLDTTFRPYTIKRNKHRVVAVRSKNRREVHIAASDLAHVLRELDYVVRDKKEPLY